MLGVKKTAAAKKTSRRQRAMEWASSFGVKFRILISFAQVISELGVVCGSDGIERTHLDASSRRDRTHTS